MLEPLSIFFSSGYLVYIFFPTFILPNTLKEQEDEVKRKKSGFLEEMWTQIVAPRPRTYPLVHFQIPEAAFG